MRRFKWAALWVALITLAVLAYRGTRDTDADRCILDYAAYLTSINSALERAKTLTLKEQQIIAYGLHEKQPSLITIAALLHDNSDIERLVLLLDNGLTQILTSPVCWKFADAGLVAREIRLNRTGLEKTAKGAQLVDRANQYLSSSVFVENKVRQQLEQNTKINIDNK